MPDPIPPQPMPDAVTLLKFALTQGVSDIHLKPGRTPVFRRSASMEMSGVKGLPVLDSEAIELLFADIMGEGHRQSFRRAGEVDFGYGAEGLGRGRVALFRSRHGVQAVIRVIPARIPGLQELGLPRVVETIAAERRGLVLVTGAAGQGKTTTLAAMADHINRVRPCHIVTIEDPIEFLIDDRRAVVTQREVGVDSPSFQSGLRAALRQDPDVILVGEMRDRETIETALMAAETGHLVLSTLHTTDARETMTRVVSVFNESEMAHARLLLSSVLRAVISQRLVNRADGRGRVPAVEVLIATGRVRDLLREPGGEFQLNEVIAQGQSQYGMQTFDQSLMGLFREGRITYDEAIKHCTNPADFALRVKGIKSSTEGAV